MKLKETVINTTKAKAQFSEVAARAAFGGETYVVERMGKPFVVVMSYERYQRLKRGEGGKQGLAEADKLRAYLKKKYGAPKQDSVELLRELRTGRAETLDRS